MLTVILSNSHSVILSDNKEFHSVILSDSEGSL